MAKSTRKKREITRRAVVVPYTHTITTPPRWRILPPEIIHIIVGLLKDDKPTLRACSLAAREFSQPALSRIGRHITLNHVSRIRLCEEMLINNSAFQHVRSLDLGVAGNGSNPEDYLEEQLTILEIFAQRRSLTRLWLSRFPFPSIESGQITKVRDIIVAFASTVNDLGLYGCRFPSYTDMISFIRAFPHCNSLYIRDCVTGGSDCAGNVLSGLPEHRLSLSVLELSCTSSKRPIIDVSSLIEDAFLDVSRLSALTCNVTSADQARAVASSTLGSPIRHFQLACIESGGFQAFVGRGPRKWTLESFTIGPLYLKTGHSFWRDAFKSFQAVPCLKELTIIYYNSKARTFLGCWQYFDFILRQKDIFPQLAQVDIQTNAQSVLSSYSQEYDFARALAPLARHLTVTLCGTYYWGY